MRTTLEIDDDLVQLAKDLAQQRGLTGAGDLDFGSYVAESKEAPKGRNTSLVGGPPANHGRLPVGSERLERRKTGDIGIKL